jgi:hypothetical protein
VLHFLNQVKHLISTTTLIVYVAYDTPLITLRTKHQISRIECAEHVLQMEMDSITADTKSKAPVEASPAVPGESGTQTQHGAESLGGSGDGCVSVTRTKTTQGMASWAG